MADYASAYTALAPRLVIHSTSEVNALLSTSVHLPDFSTLLSPFKDSVERVNLRTHTLESNVQANKFPLRFDEAQHLSELGPWELHGGWLDQVGNEVQAKAGHWIDQVKRPSETPWFDHFKERLASVRPVVPHNTLSQPMVYLLVTSAQHPEPMNALADLYASTSPAAVEARYPYMDPNVLRYYVVLHDVRSSAVSRADSQALLDQVRKTYGIHCALLDIHSWDPDAPPPLEGPPDTRPSSFDTLWDPFLPPGYDGGKADMGERDAYHIRVFLRELVIMSLIPWMERNIQSWNESLAASRRGFTGRLFSAGRRFLSSNAAKDPNHPHAYDHKRGCYPHMANEAQTRKLADWAFVLRDYRLAGAMYEVARKEFTTDRVWTDYAHACHMQALSHVLHFLQAPHQSSPQALTMAESLIAEAYTSTLHLTGTQAAAAQLDDIKSVCLHLDAFKRAGHVHSAPTMLVRSAGNVEEISAALLLEQAAISNLDTRSRRKAGFHYCLAAIRYEKTGGKLLAQHCLTQASHVYGSDRLPQGEQDPEKPYDVSAYAVTSWPLIENHIDQASGRQAYHLGQHESALRHFLCTLNRSAVSDGDAVDQGAWDDLKLARDGLGDKAEEVLAAQGATLDQSIFNVKSTRVVLSNEQPASKQSPVPTSISEELERQMLSDGFEDLAQKPKSFNEGRHGNVAAVSQPFFVELEARNPFDAWLILTDVQLHLDSQSDAIQGLKAQKVDIEPRGSTKFSVSVTCSEESTFAVDSVTFIANNLLKCQESLQRKGARLQKTREQRLTPTYAPDHSLRVSVRQPIPKLQLDVSQLPSELLAGETCLSSIVVKNCTSVPVADLRVLSSHPNFILPLSSPTNPYTPTDSSPSPLNVSASLLQNTSVKVLWANDQSDISIPVLCRGDYPGSRSVSFLLAYSSQHSPSIYLSATSSCRLKTAPSLNIRSSVQPTRSTDAPYQIAVEVHNGHVEEKVYIDAVYSLSPAWRLAAKSEQADKVQSMQLDPQQSTTCIQSLKPIALDAVPCEPAWTCHQLEKLLQGESIKDDRPGHDDVHVQASSTHDQSFDWHDSCLRSSWLASRSSLRRIALRNQFPSVDKNLHAGLFRLFTQRSLDLVITWSLPHSNIHGHHLVADLQIGPSIDTVSALLDRASGIAGGIYAESQRERAHVLSNFRESDYAFSQMPIKIIPSVPSETVLSTRQSCAHVQATFTLHNQSLSDTCDLVFSLTAPAHAQLSGRWSGRTKFARSLAPGALSEVRVTALFTQPGLCQTGSWLLQARSGKRTWQEAGEGVTVSVQSGG